MRLTLDLVKSLGAVAILSPWLLQLVFNLAIRGCPWYAYWPLLAVTSVVPLGWLVRRKYPAFFVSIAIQLAVLSWFNWHQYEISETDFRGASAFAGGLGVVYALVFSLLGGLLAGMLVSIALRKQY